MPGDSGIYARIKYLIEEADDGVIWLLNCKEVKAERVSAVKPNEQRCNATQARDS